MTEQVTGQAEGLTPEMAVAGRYPEIRSFVRRSGRITDAQRRALEQLGPRYILTLPEPENGVLDFGQVFGNAAPVVAEIGFGMGQGFIEMAVAQRECNFLGFEVHLPGIGACLQRIRDMELTNVRIITEDAVPVLRTKVAPGSLSAIQIFFPDPWPKKRQSKRRLVNEAFVTLCARLISPGGELRLATDSGEYAEQMLNLATACPQFVNTASDGGFLPRPDWRPVSKYETRALRLGHQIWDLVFRRRTD